MNPINEDPRARFTGIFIPAEILEMEELSLLDIMTLSWIDALQNNEKGGCFASNEYLSEKLKMKKDTVSKSITKLKKLGLIRQLSFDGRMRILVSYRWFHKHQSYSDSDCNPRGVGLQSYADSYQNPMQTPTKILCSHIDSKEESKEQQQQLVVVVSPDSESFDLLKAQGFDDKTASSLAKFPIEQIHRQIEHLKNAQDLIAIDNPLGWLRNAIQNDWRPAEPKIDPSAEAAELRRKQLLERTDAKLQCEDIFDEYERQFTTKKYFILGDDVLTMRSGDKNFGIPYDNGTVKTLKRFIDIEFQHLT